MKKKWYEIIDSVSFSLIVLLFSYFFIAIGSIEATNEIVSKSLLIILRIGIYLKKAFPLFLALNYVGSNKKDIIPFIGTIICYILLNIITMVLSSTMYDASFYKDVFGLALDEKRMPLNLGIFGSILVILIINFAYKVAKKRYNYGILNFISNDAWFFVVAVSLTIMAGIFVSFGYGYTADVITRIMNFISTNSSNPVAMYCYGVLYKIMEIAQMDSVIQNNFLFGSLGGSWINAQGNTVLGDVSIWTAQVAEENIALTTGRYTTGFYIINLFVVPSLIIAALVNIKDKIEFRKKSVLAFVAIVVTSFTGSTLPVEYYLLLTSPLLLIIHIILSGFVFLACQMQGLYLGSVVYGPTNSVFLGNLGEFIHYFRMIDLNSTVVKLIITGLISFVIYQVVTFIYYRYLAFDFLDREEKKKDLYSIVSALGGL
ncbi:MAG: hypothetical protein ACI4WG_01840, partial [Erysipelotrichaceae bacterium]